MGMENIRVALSRWIHIYRNKYNVYINRILFVILWESFRWRERRFKVEVQAIHIQSYMLNPCNALLRR